MIPASCETRRCINVSDPVRTDWQLSWPEICRSDVMTQCGANSLVNLPSGASCPPGLLWLCILGYWICSEFQLCYVRITPWLRTVQRLLSRCWPGSPCDSGSACHIMAHNCPALLDPHIHIGFYSPQLLEVKWVMRCFIQKAQLQGGSREEDCVI